MTRTYVRTHVGLMDDEDYMVLSPTGIAAWHTVNMLQGAQTEERFKNRAQITALLRRHGFGDFAPDAMAELERHGWIIDHPDRPGVVLKGWSRWQAQSRSDYMKDRREQARYSNDTVTIQARTDTPHVPSRHVPSQSGVSPIRGRAYEEPEPQTVEQVREAMRRLFGGDPPPVVPGEDGAG